jgi:hypothetical protein
MPFISSSYSMLIEQINTFSLLIWYGENGQFSNKKSDEQAMVYMHNF